MRTIRIIAALTFCIIVSIPALSQKYTPKNSRNYEIINLESGTNTKTFKIYVIEKNERKAISLAKKAAVEVCIFRGLPSSSAVSGTPALCSSADAQKYADYFERFFTPGGQYLQYVNTTSEGRLSGNDKLKVKGGWKIGLTVQILYNNLRNDLQDAGVIRSLSSGF